MLAEQEALFRAAGGGPEAEETWRRCAKPSSQNGVSWSLQAAVAAIFIKAAVITSLALLVSTFASSSLFTMVTAAVVYFAGHLQADIRAFYESMPGWENMAKFAAVPLAMLLPDFQLFNVVDAAVAGESVGWDVSAASPASGRLCRHLHAGGLDYLPGQGNLSPGMLRKPAICLAILCAFGSLRWPLESAATRDFKARHILPPDLGLGLREKIGQNSYAAALGGARSFIASIQNLMAFVAWENQDWGARRKPLPAGDRTPAPRPVLLGNGRLAHGLQRQRLVPLRLERPERRATTRRAPSTAPAPISGNATSAKAATSSPTACATTRTTGSSSSRPACSRRPAQTARPRARRPLLRRRRRLPGAPARLRRFEAYELSFVPGRQAEALAQLAALYAGARATMSPPSSAPSSTSSCRRHPRRPTRPARHLRGHPGRST